MFCALIPWIEETATQLPCSYSWEGQVDSSFKAQNNTTSLSEEACVYFESRGTKSIPSPYKSQHSLILEVSEIMYTRSRIGKLTA